MSGASIKEEDTSFCASCGTVGGDDIKLKKCACKLVKYCGVKCQKDHRPKHKKECKKRVAELRDELLFKQPESNCFGDCPICCLPVPADIEKIALMTCCGKIICDSCSIANKHREDERRLQHTCAFCRTALPETDEEINELLMRRVEANDAAALSHMGTTKFREEDYIAAFAYYSKAADLGYADAHYHLSGMYHNGQGVEKDEKRVQDHTETAAIAGHPIARYNLGCTEWENGRADRAAKHFIIAAKLGSKKSLDVVKDLYKDGLVSKDDFAAALRGHQAAIAATKSP